MTNAKKNMVLNHQILSSEDVRERANEIEEIWADILELIGTYEDSEDQTVRFMIMKRFRDVAEKIEEMESQIESNQN